MPGFHDPIENGCIIYQKHAVGIFCFLLMVLSLNYTEQTILMFIHMGLLLIYFTKFTVYLDS